jgi:hypothetical protein
VYDTFTAPVATPDTTPEEFTVALARLLLLHTPPPVLLLNVVVDDLHTEEEPDIEPG